MIAEWLRRRHRGDVLPVQPEVSMVPRCMTHEKDKMPNPSLLKLPPNRFVSSEAFSPVALDDARQGTDTEFSHGMT